MARTLDIACVSAAVTAALAIAQAPVSVAPPIPARTGSTSCPAPNRVGPAKGLEDTIRPAAFVGALPKSWTAGKPLRIYYKACDDYPTPSFQLVVHAQVTPDSPAWKKLAASSPILDIGGPFKEQWQWSKATTWMWRKPKAGRYFVCAVTLDTALNIAQMCKPLTVRPARLVADVPTTTTTAPDVTTTPDPSTTTTATTTTTTTASVAPGPLRVGSTTCPGPQRAAVWKGLPDQTPPAVFLGAVPKTWRAGKPLSVFYRACDNFPYVLMQIEIHRQLDVEPGTLRWQHAAVAVPEYFNVGGLFRGTWKFAGSETWTWRTSKAGSYYVCAIAMDTQLNVAQMCKPLVVR